MSILPPIDGHYAYGRGNVLVEAVMRISAVKRWHMIDTTRTQTLAEHAANVGLLAYIIAGTSPRAFFGAPEEALECGILHDMPEVFLGDIPTHTKRWLSGGELELAEQSITPRFLRSTPSPDLKQLIKICDLVDGIRFVRLHGVDMTAEHAMVGLEEQLHRAYATSREKWPPEVWQNAYRKTHFYAYEQEFAKEAGDPIAGGSGCGDGTPLADDVARRS
jgi:5'-deoxynucleotidase YfbR-like HD superfamily hydrolase